MPQLANLVVKKSDSANVTYTALMGSAGDKLPAVWRDETFNAQISNRPLFTLQAKSAKAGAQRILEGKFVYPELVTNTTTNTTTVKTRCIGSFSCTVDQNTSSVAAKDFAAIFGNIIASALVSSSIVEGYAPRAG